MNETPTDKRPTSIRLDPQVKDQLDAYCKREKRSQTSAVNYLLGKALAEAAATR